MNEKIWSNAVILFVVLLLATVAIINYIVDPSGIYVRKNLNLVGELNIAKKLFSSNNGVINTGLNERAFKLELAKNYNDFDCIVLGSSHVMQISSIRNTGGITTKCKKLLNLGVSGGTIEDIAIFSSVILHNNTVNPKVVLIGIDPWTLKFEMDVRYKQHSLLYDEMNKLLKVSPDIKGSSYLQDRAMNLLNVEYLLASIKKIVRDRKRQILYPEADFTYEDGYVEPIVLPDGSLVYGEDFIKASKTKVTLRENYDYKINGEYFDQRAVNYIEKLIYLYKGNNISVVLVMTPYAPKVFIDGDTKVVIYLRAVDEVVRDIASNTDAKVYGSFFSRVFGCKSSEFYDFMHPTNECLNRIDFSK